jgi:SAM-dependent methyltransferase
MQEPGGGLPIMNNPAPPAPSARARWLLRAGEAETIRRRLARRSALGMSAMLRRLAGSTAGTLLKDTPIIQLQARLNLQAKHRVLDLQAGQATALRLLAARIPFHQPPVALDSAPPVPQPARAGEPAVDVIGGLPEGLPFADSSFDLVIAAHLFRHLDDLELVDTLREAHRVLKPAGVVIGWEFAPRSSTALNRLHLRLLGDGRERLYLRGFGPLVYAATEAGFHAIERPLLPPFLFPPIPRTAILAQKDA